VRNSNLGLIVALGLALTLGPRPSGAGQSAHHRAWLPTIRTTPAARSTAAWLCRRDGGGGNYADVYKGLTVEVLQKGAGPCSNKVRVPYPNQKVVRWDANWPSCERDTVGWVNGRFLLLDSTPSSSGGSSGAVISGTRSVSLLDVDADVTGGVHPGSGSAPPAAGPASNSSGSGAPASFGSSGQNLGAEP